MSKKRAGDGLLKPQAAEGEQVSVRKIHSRQVYEGLGQEWMQMIVVDDSSALDDAEGGPYLRLGPSSGLRDTDQDGIRAAVSCEGVSLCGSDAEFPVLGIIGCLIG